MLLVCSMATTVTSRQAVCISVPCIDDNLCVTLPVMKNLLMLHGKGYYRRLGISVVGNLEWILEPQNEKEQ